MTFADIHWDIFLGGLGLFLFGIVLMGDGLKSFAGDKLRVYIDKYTSKPWQGLLIGLVMTAAIQSSSATTAICIGFVREGLMTLEQSAGIIIGANIGTTVTAFLIGLNVDELAVYMIFIGAMILLFNSKKKPQDVARILVGFGILFYSLTMMSDALADLKEVPQFIAFAEMCTRNPLIGLVGGIILTVAMQSSSASIGIVQLFYMSGAISFIGVIPFLYGANIGTCITAILASLGGKVAAKRAAALHLSFNIIGTAIGFMMMYPLYGLMNHLSLAYGIQPMMQIAITHIIFNVAAAAVVYPLIRPLCKLIKKVIPGQEVKRLEINIDELNPKNFPMISAALSVSYEYVKKLRDIVITNMNNTQSFLNCEKYDEEDFDNIRETENVINKVDASITKFITELSYDHMSQYSIETSNLYLEVTKNLERLGDLTINIAEFAKMVHEDQDKFTDEALKEINTMFGQVFEMLDQSFAYMETRQEENFSILMNKEDELDRYEYQFRKNHFKRLATKECMGAVAGSIFADVLGTLERMGDHCCNIAKHAAESNPSDN